MLREGTGISLRLPERTTATVKARLVVKLAGDVTKRQLAFAIPSALASQLHLTIEQDDADVDFPTAVTLRRTADDKTTRIEAILGAHTRVELFWTPRMKRATEVAASVFAQNTSLVTIGGGLVNTRTTLDYQVAQGELRQARVRVPAGELAKTLAVKSDDLFSAYRFLKPGFRLTARAEAIQPQIEAVVHSATRVGFEQVSLTAEVDYTVKKPAARLPTGPAGVRSRSLPTVPSPSRLESGTLAAWPQQFSF